ncbi:MAG: MazG nucleotide pyrophosphohydrolase domain-containing protein [bacterium]
MDLSELIKRAKDVRDKYAALERKMCRREWSGQDLLTGFVGDVGDLTKLIMAKEGLRKAEDLDEKLEHELSDCLWSVLVLADKYGVDIEKSFLQNMDELEKRIDEETE